MKYKVRLFGLLQELTGREALDVECAPDSESLRTEVERLCPMLKATAYAIAVDLRIVHGTVLLHDTSDVALVPPFSGG